MPSEQAPGHLQGREQVCRQRGIHEAQCPFAFFVHCLLACTGIPHAQKPMQRNSRHIISLKQPLKLAAKQDSALPQQLLVAINQQKDVSVCWKVQRAPDDFSALQQTLLPWGTTFGAFCGCSQSRLGLVHPLLHSHARVKRGPHHLPPGSS